MCSTHYNLHYHPTITDESEKKRDCIIKCIEDYLLSDLTHIIMQYTGRYCCYIIGEYFEYNSYLVRIEEIQHYGAKLLMHYYNYGPSFDIWINANDTKLRSAIASNCSSTRGFMPNDATYYFDKCSDYLERERNRER